MPGIQSRRISCCDAASAPRSSSSLLSSSSSSAAAAEAATDNYVTMYDRRNCIARRRSVSATCRWILLLIFVGTIDAVLSSSGITTTFHNFRFNVEPSDIVATVGQSAILDCGVSVRSDESDATSGSAVDVRWMKDDTLIVFDNRRNVLSNGSLYFSMVESSPSHRPDEGMYQCVATARGAGAIISRKARLSLSYVEVAGSSNPIDQQLTPAARLELQPGDRLMLPCPVRGLPRPRTRWYRNDVELDAAALTTTGVSSSAAARTTSRALIHEDGVLELGDLQPSDAGRYRCRLDAGNESKYSNVSTALVVDSGRQAAYKVHPQFIMKPRDTLATEGATVLLHCGANGRDRKLAAPRIDWLRDGSTIDVSNEPDRVSIVGAGSLRISPVLDQDSALYTCRASNMEESIDGDATLSVQVAPRIRVLPKDTAVPGNTDVELPCSASGVPAPSVTWVKDGDTVIPSDYFQLIDGGNLRILGVLASDAGMYQCIAGNAVGNVQATAQLLVSSNDISSSASSSSSSSSFTVTSSQHPSGLPQGTTESPAVGVPSAPVDLLAAHVSVRFITLSWRPPAHSGLSDITGYTVYWKDATSDRERIMNTTDVEAHVQQLIPATRYEFRVVAWNSLGSSRQTATLAVETLPEALVPDAPVNVRVTSIQTSSVHLAWESPVNSNGPIVTYKVYYYSPEDDEGELDLNVDVAECVLSELGRFRQYVIRVVAFNANGPGIESEEITCRTLSDVPSLPPQNVSIEALSSSSVLVRWEPPPQSALNGIITGYKIRYRPRGDKNGDTITTDGSRRMYDITDLHRHTEYSVRIHAMTVNGSGPATPWLNVETFANDLDETDVPGPPTALNVRAQFNSIQVSWTAPAESHKMVRGYVLGYGIGIPDVFRQVLDAQLRSFHIKSLKPSSEYVISLKAFNNVGEGEPVYENVFTREETTPEPLTPMMPPVGVKAVVLSSTSVLLTWTDTSLGRNQHVTDSRYYVIRYNPKLFRKPRLVNTTELNFHLDDLRPDTEYEFSIKVVKGQRQSTWSLSVFNQTGQAAPTTAPRDLTVSLIDNRPHWASLSWQPPRQPNGQITGYLVFYSTDATLQDRDWAIEGVLGDRTTVTIRDLSTYSTYYFKIQARNSMGYGPLSPTVIFRTSAVGSDGSLYTDEESLKFGGVKDGSGSMPTYVLWIIIGSIGLVSVIATTVILVVVCRRRSTKKRQDDEAADADNDEPKTTIGALKPPDLWIHDQVERRTSSANSGTEAAPSVAGSQGFNDDSLSVDTVQEDERYRRMAIRPPLMIPIDHPPQPRDPLALVKPNGHLTSPDGSPFGGLGVIRTGLYPRPTALQYTHSTPRVNAGDLCQPSLQADYALSTLDRHRKLRDMPPSKLGSNPRLAVQPQAQSYGNNRYQSSVPSSTSSSSSSSSKATPPPSTSLLMSATGKSKSQLPAIVGSRSPDVTLRSETSPQDIQKSVSTEELSAEMANLEGLMKDLNAITQHEFHC